MTWLTEQDVLDAQHQFGRLDRAMVKIAMGPNFPPDWEYIGIFYDEFAPDRLGDFNWRHGK